MAWRLVDALQNEQKPLRKGVLQVFYLESNPMAAIEWETQRVLRQTIQRLGRTSLTAPGFVAIGSAYSEATPDFDPIQEQAYKMGLDIDTPKEYVDGYEGQFEALRALGVEAALKAATFLWNWCFIDGPNVSGDGNADPNAFVGLKARIASTANLTGLSNAVINAGGGANGTLFGPTATSSNRHAVIDSINQSIYFIDGHAPSWAFSNDSFLLAFESALRREGLFNQQRDQFDRFVYRYRGVEFYDIGVRLDQSTKIIPDTETLGTSTDCTSLYFGCNGSGTHFWGWEAAPLNTRDLGELQASPSLRTRVDWTTGLVNAHQRALSRVQGIRATT